MPLSEEKIKAYKQMDEAVAALRKAYGYDDDILKGWVLNTASVEFIPENEREPDDDDLDLRACQGWYTQRGQDPTLSYGILHEAIRHYNKVQED